jgi:hypothetical protein
VSLYREDLGGLIGFEVGGEEVGWVFSGTATLAPSGVEVVTLSISPSKPYGRGSRPPGHLYALVEELGGPVPLSPSGGVTSELLRRIPLGKIKQLIRLEVDMAARTENWLDELARASGLSPLPMFEKARRIKKAAASAPKSGRRRYTDDHYRELAEEYIRLVVIEGRTRGVLAGIAEWLSGRQGYEVAIPTARDHVRRARELGYLAPSKQGKVTAEPGPRLASEGQAR